MENLSPRRRGGAGTRREAADGEPSPRKRARRLASGGAILEAATTLFLRSGYLGTSMDEVAAAAGVSKQTIYTHFADKEELFTTLVLDGVSRRADVLLEAIARLEEAQDDVERHLREYAIRSIENPGVDPDVLRFRRLVIGEAARFPELARTYYEVTYERAEGALASALRTLTNRGLLHVDDPKLAAWQFGGLTLYMAQARVTFRGVEGGFTKAELEHAAGEAVRVFMAAYG